MLAAFDAIYVINLESRPDRRAEMALQLARVGLSFDAPNVHLFPAVRPADAGMFESVGARGCFMSHLGVLKAATGKRNVLILEDDLDFAQAMRPLELPADWGIFYGGARHALAPVVSPLTDAGPQDDVGCAHFIAFNGPEIPRVAAFLELLLTRKPGDPSGGPMHVDGAYNVYRERNPGVRTVVATPELGHQRSSRSDIAPGRWFDHGGFAPLASFARRLRRSLIAR